MKFTKPIHEGVFLKRYKRFFADILLNGQEVVAHVPNSGSMKTCNIPNSPCLVSFDDNPERKLKYTLEMVKAPSSWVGVNTQVPNKIVKEAIEKKLFSHWQTFPYYQAEAKINDKSRLDFVLSNQEIKDFKKIDLKKVNQKFHFIEVKNVSLAENNIAYFPDAVTERGQKHLEELMHLIDLGFSAEILFTIQRTDVEKFKPAKAIDPKYAALLKQAQSHGVLITPVLCDLSSKGVELTDQILKIDFD